MFSIGFITIKNPFSSCTTTKVTIVDPLFYTAEQVNADNKYWEEFFAKTSMTELNEEVNKTPNSTPNF